MKLRQACLITSLIIISSTAFAFAQNDAARMAIEGTIATDGAIGAGIVRYAPNYEVGLTLSGLTSHGDDDTSLFSPSVFAGWRKSLAEQTYFAAGVNYTNTSGTEDGEHIHSDNQIGPYVSIEQALTQHVLLVGWIDPYSYEYADKTNGTTTTNRFLASGGIGINYLF